ncbi:MAG: hypothetical protein ACK4X1_11580 [Terricaulis sp.]
MNRLLMPLSYLTIKHSVKIWYDLIYPLLFAVPLGSFLALTRLNYNVVGERGLVETFNGLLALLIGFFIAALAAVAMFERKSMDELMLGDVQGAKLRLS